MLMNIVSVVSSRLAKDRGCIDTPSYVYFPEILDVNYASLKECLGTNLIVSIKANSNVDLLSLSVVDKDGYEGTSLEELKIITQLGAKEKFINNPSMDQGLLRKSILSGATVIVDNLNQIEFLKNIKEDMDIPPVMLRVNPKALSTYYKCLDTTKGDHFGMSVEDIDIAIDRLKEMKISILGLHIFKGSHSFKKSAFETLDLIKLLSEHCENKLGYSLSKLNFGGGFSSDWSVSGFDYESYRNKLKSFFSGYDLYHEAGRALFEAAGIYVTKVISTKTLGASDIAICDGGLAHNFLLAQTESTFKKFRKPSFVVSAGKRATHGECTIVGSSCNKDDVVGKIPEGEANPSVDDLIIFDRCGAYNQVYSPINFLSLKKAASYLMFLDKSEIVSE